MKRIIGVIGTIASGKDIAARYIAQKFGIPEYSISHPLKRIAAERGMPVSRENLTVLGRELAAQKGLAYLAEIIFQDAPDFFVVSGMRQVPQIEFFRQHAELFLIAVDADPAIRFERALKRGDVKEAPDLEHFIRAEREENAGEVQRVFDCIALADARVANDGSIEDLYAKLDQALMGAPAVKTP